MVKHSRFRGVHSRPLDSRNLAQHVADRADHGRASRSPIFLPILLRGVSGCKASLEAVYSSEARGGLRLDQRTNHSVVPASGTDATSLTSGAQQSSAELVSGNEAVALAAFDAGVSLGTGYPGTPSTEILEAFDSLGGRAHSAPNEKVALEVGLGVSLAGARSIVTMKHVGLNVAADPLFTAAYLELPGALVVLSADDPGMASSQNEQDNRRYAVAAGVAMLEPSDSQEAYEFTLRAIEIAERWRKPVML